MFGLEESTFVLHDYYSDVECGAFRSMISDGKHGKTDVQKQKAVSKRNKKNKKKENS